MYVPEIHEERKKISGLKMPRSYTPRLPGASVKGQAPVNPYSGNRVKVASLSEFRDMQVARRGGPLTDFIQKRASLPADPLYFFFAELLKEAGVGDAIARVPGMLKGMVGGATKATKTVKGKPVQRLKAVGPSQTQMRQAAPHLDNVKVVDNKVVNVAGPGAGQRAYGSSAKSRRKFLRKQMLAEQLDAPTGALGAEVGGVNRNVQVGLDDFAQGRRGLRSIEGSPVAPRAGSAMERHVDAVGSRNITVAPGRSAVSPATPAAPRAVSKATEKTFDVAKFRALRQQGVPASEAAAQARIAPVTPKPKDRSLLGKAILGGGALAATGGVAATVGYGAGAGQSYGTAQNARLANRGFDYGMHRVGQ